MDTVKEVKRSLTAAKKLVGSVSSLIGEQKNVKCIVDSESNYQLTSNGLNYLKAIESQDWVYGALYEHCYNFEQSFGFGSEEFLTYVGCWSECFLNLIAEDVPLDLIKHCTSRILQNSIQHLLAHHTKHWNSLQDLAGTINRKSCTRNSSTRKYTSTLAQKEYEDKKHTIQTNRNSEAKIKTASRNSKVNFMRYSRHAMVEATEEEANVKLHTVEESLTTIVKSVCCIEENENLCELLCKVVSMMYNDYHELRKSSPSGGFPFHFDSKNVILQPCRQSPPISGSKVFEGILVPRTTKDFYYGGDKFIIFNQTTVDIVLVNTIAYGDNIHGNSDSVSIREIIKYERLSTASPVNSSDLYLLNTLRDRNLVVIFHHGEFDESVRECCIGLNFLLIRVPDYEMLYRISAMTGASISFGFNCEITDSDIKRASLSFVPSSSMDKLTTGETKTQLKLHRDNILGYIQVHNRPGSPKVATPSSIDSFYSEYELLYTVLLHSRSIDLQQLHAECFSNGLRRVEHFFTKSKCSMKDNVGQYSSEIKLFELLKNYVLVESKQLNEDLYHTPEWLRTDVQLFHKLIAEQMSLAIENYCKLVKDNYSVSPHLEDIVYKTSLWSESLYCVNKISSTVKFDISSF